MSAPCQCLLLNQAEILEVGATDIQFLLEAVEEGFRLHGQGDCTNPPKVALGRPGRPRDLVMALPGYLGGQYHMFGVKWVLAIPDNLERGLPRSSGLIVLNDGETGWPLCIMDGTIVNIVRTGAVSGVGARHLARPDSRRLCLIGAGPQGRMQVTALAAVLPLDEVEVFDLNRERAEQAAAYLAERLGLAARAVDEPAPAVRAADVVVTATIAQEPYLAWDWLRPGTLYVDMASHDAYPEVYLRADKVIVDDWRQLKEHGIGTLPELYASGRIGDDGVYGELGEVVVGAKAGRSTPEEVIVFKHIGIAATDLPVAAGVYHRARERGLGTPWTVWETPWSPM